MFALPYAPRLINAAPVFRFTETEGIASLEKVYSPVALATTNA